MRNTKYIIGFLLVILLIGIIAQFANGNLSLTSKDIKDSQYTKNTDAKNNGNPVPKSSVPKLSLRSLDDSSNLPPSAPLLGSHAIGKEDEKKIDRLEILLKKMSQSERDASNRAAIKAALSFEEREKISIFLENWQVRRDSLILRKITLASGSKAEVENKASILLEEMKNRVGLILGQEKSRIYLSSVFEILKSELPLNSQRSTPP